MADYTISAKITGDSSGFDKAIQSAEKTASSFEKRMESISSKAKSIGDKLSGIGTALTVGVTTPLAVAGKGMVDAASDFDENLNKISVAFGDSADDVKAWADTATESFGLSMNQALEATSLFGDMATSMGISQSEAASMSTSLAGLAGDMASFKNIGIDEAMTALNGVFTGETESLKQLGIVMTEVNLQEFADGLGLVYNDMTQAEKVQLRYNYVMAMSKNAIGDYARTSDGTANSMRTFQASVENLAITLGQNLLPIVTPIIQKATEMVNAFAAADPQLQQLILKIAGIAAVAGPALLVIGKMVSVFGSVSGAIGLLGGKIAELGGMGNAISAVFTAITSPVGIAVGVITALVAAFAYLMTTNEGFRNSIMQTVTTIGQSLMPIIQALMPVIQNIATVLATTIASVLQALAPVLAQIVTMIGQIVSTVAPLIAQLVASLVPVLEQLITMGLQIIEMVLPVVADILAQLMPVIIQIVELVGNLVAELAPLISQLISALMPVIMEIISTVMEIVSSLMPPLIAVIEAVMAVIEALMPPIMQIIDVVVDVISSVMTAISPIISFIAEIIGKIIEVITPIIQFVAEVIGAVISVVSPLLEFFGTIFGAIFEVVADIMGAIGEFIGGIFEGVKGAWDGLTGFVGGVFDGISSAFDALVGVVKGVINGVIGAINGAIWVINLIPGVEIGTIPYLLHGTDDWQGGFARMNEGGRGELTYLPNGAQVIPHDISVKYAKEAARANVQQAEPAVFVIDYDRLAAAMTSVRLTPVVTLDGERVSRGLSPYTDAEMGDRARMAARGMI